MLTTILDALPTCVFWKDLEFRYAGCNKRFAENIGGRTPVEIIGRTDYDFYDAMLADSFRSTDQLVISAGYSLSDIIESIPLPNGATRWLKTNKVPLRNAEGQIIGLLGAYHDVVERKELENVVLAAEQAEALKQARTYFFATADKELRAPLNGILGMAEALAASDLDQTQNAEILTILDTGKILISVLNDMLDLSKMEAGRLVITPADRDLRHIIEQVYKLWLAPAREHGVRLTLTIQDNVPRWLNIDALRIRQCLSNLISNAIKYTEDGSVHIAVSAENRDETESFITVTVTDTGIGMSERTLAALFAPVHQNNPLNFSSNANAGLGLSVSRELAHSMGGDITVKSSLGMGAIFTFTFLAGMPLNIPHDSEAAINGRADISQMPDLHGIRILIVDDNEANRHILHLFLDPTGCIIGEAKNGREGLKLLEQERFDLILLDIHMPVMDGRHLIGRIRNSKAEWRDIPVIALTTSGISIDRDRYLALGMNGFLLKPFTQNQLYQEIERVMEALNASPDGRMKPANECENDENKKFRASHNLSAESSDSTARVNESPA